MSDRDYRDGYRQALGDAGLCGAYNFDDPPQTRYAACIRRSKHIGKHDDGWRTWGSKDATADDNLAAEKATRRAELSGTPVVSGPADEER